MFKKLFKSKGAIIWMSVTCLLLIVVIVANILIFNMFQTLFNFAFGGPEAVYAEGVSAMYPATESSSKEEAFQNANAMNITLEEEGAVLLKNENKALPLAKGAKVSVFGKNSVNLSYGNSGSSGGNISDAKTLYDGLAEADFECNPTLKAFYEDTKLSGPVREANSSDLDSGDTVMVATAETPQSKYTEEVKNSYAEYNDAAIVVITRIGGEGWDLPRSMKGMEGARKDDDHYLQLDQNETDLLKAVCEAGFERVIVLLNTPSSMEAGFLTDPDYYAYQSKIDACLWMGFPGREGTVAVGRILNGDVNPSGHTVDTWAADFKKDPTFQNFGDNNVAGGDMYNTVTNPETGLNFYFVDYEEGVYVGYRYYETRAAEYDGAIEAIGEEEYENGEEWYQNSVVFPFGYGLSYTTFEWTLQDDSALKDVALEKGKTYTVSVEVENTGDVAGKDVVQAYVNAPYYEGGIEKPYVVLAAYAKTGLLQPGEKETVELTIDPYYFASYDYRDANGNGIMGYELEEGDYNLFVSRNAHDHEFTVPFTVGEGGILYEEDPVTGEYVENRYTDYGPWPSSDAQLSTVLSRSDWNATFPDPPTDAERNLEIEGGDSIKEDLLAEGHNNFTDFESMEMPKFEVKGSGLTFRDFLPDEAPAEATYEPIVDYYDERWDNFLDMCSIEEMKNLVYYAAYETAGIDSVGVPMTKMYDGPTGFTNFGNEGAVYQVGTYCCEPVVASTWNTELVEEFGETMGEEGFWGNANSGMPYTGIYAPGANIHRSPFGGRCGEYFSEDSFLSGKMAAAEIRGLQKKGVVTAIKHFVANEQETHRSINGDSSWLTEQSLREICLRPFEIAVKEGGARAVMTSFNRIGTRWTGGDYRLLTEILRNEWGFKGFVVTDFNTCPEYMHAEQMAYAGGDLNLATIMYNGQDWCDSNDKADLIVLRQNVKNALYALVNSNAMNGEVVGYKMATWQVLTIVIDCVVVAALAVWGVFAIRGALKKSKAEPEQTDNGAKN